MNGETPAVGQTITNRIVIGASPAQNDMAEALASALTDHGVIGMEKTTTLIKPENNILVVIVATNGKTHFAETRRPNLSWRVYRTPPRKRRRLELPAQGYWKRIKKRRRSKCAKTRKWGGSDDATYQTMRLKKRSNFFITGTAT